MQGIISTVDTLYSAIIRFTVDGIVRFVKLYAGVTIEGFSSIATIEDQSEQIHDDRLPTFKKVEDVLRVKVHSIAHSQRETSMYVCNTNVSLYKNPTIEFDTQISLIPYGEKVLMLEPRGRFSKVVWNSIEGWILRENLIDRSTAVYPEFLVGSENSADHVNTIHVRAILNDPFNLKQSEFPLQAGEYVLYRLWKKGTHIEWPASRPRIPGAWHRILRGVPRIYMNVIPNAGSIIEYMINPEIGHLAFVEAVFPDETIHIAEANYPHSGIYNERDLTKLEWKELRPVCIQVQ